MRQSYFSDRGLMAGASLVAALVVNFSIGVIKLTVGLLTGSAAMRAEALHSFADTFNQILLALGIRRSGRKPDLEHPFGYSKVQFFWAFVVAILIFGISGTLAFIEGLEIIQHPSAHGEEIREALESGTFIWNVVVLIVAIGLEYFAFRTAYRETKEFQEKFQSETVFEALDEMQDPVLLSLLVEDSLALLGLIIALIGSLITLITRNPLIDGITSLLIGLVLMAGGLLLARENKQYLIGKAVSDQIQRQIDDIVKKHEGILEVKAMKTMLLGPHDMLLALDIRFSDKVRKSGISKNIDLLEKKLSENIPHLSPGKIFIEAQL